MGKHRKAGRIIGICFLSMILFNGCGLQPNMLRSSQDAAKEDVSDISQDVVEEEFGSSPQTEESESVQGISDGNYAYECLSEEGKKVYDQMLDAILSYHEKVELATTDTGLMREAYQALCCDYGGLFWVEGYVFTSYTRGDEMIGLEFAPTYVMDKEDKEKMQHRVDAVVDEWLSGISIHDSDYEKARYVFETLIEKVDYVEGAQDNQNILSVFLNRQTVCQGYACATQYLLRQLGIPSTIISGYANNQTHAWNIVKLDGNYYHMDTTWGNSTYLDTESQKAKFVNYNFMCMTDEEISHTHQSQMSFPLPECNSMENNYYVREGRYFENWDPEAIGAVFGGAWEKGEPSIAVKCGDDEIYNMVKEYFIKQQKISDYCSGIEYVYYMESPELHVFTVNFN